MTTKPSIFFNVLKQVDGLRYFFPEIHRLIGVPQRKEYHPEGDCFIHTMLVLDKSAELSADLVVRYSALVHDLGKGVTPKSILPRHVGHENAGVPLVRQMGERLKIPSYWTETAMVVTKHHLKVHRIKEMRPNSIVRLFYEMDSFRKPKLVSILAQVCEADELGKMKGEPKEGKFLEACFSIVKEVSAQTVKNEVQGKKLGEAIRAERVRRLKGFIFGNDFATPSFMK